MRASVNQPPEGQLLFEVDPQPIDEQLTALGSVSLLLQAIRSLDVGGRVRRKLQLKQRRRRLDEAGYFESFIVLNAVGGECLDDFERLREDPRKHPYMDKSGVYCSRLDEREWRTFGWKESITMAKKTFLTSKAMLIQAEAGQGDAAPFNRQPANFLIVVSDPVTGAAVTNLTRRSFGIINHFSVPGQTCGFSNSITSFNNVGTGAYHIQVKPRGCDWVRGDYLSQVIVSSKGRNGQAAATLSIR